VTCPKVIVIRSTRSPTYANRLPGLWHPWLVTATDMRPTWLPVKVSQHVPSGYLTNASHYGLTREAAAAMTDDVDALAEALKAKSVEGALGAPHGGVRVLPVGEAKACLHAQAMMHAHRSRRSLATSMRMHATMPGH
jgi:hypothetical protein